MEYKVDVWGGISMSDKEFDKIDMIIPINNVVYYNYCNNVLSINNLNCSRDKFNEFLDIVVKNISIRNLNVVSYEGDNYGDTGIYYIYPGKWERLKTIVPLPSEKFRQHIREYTKK